MVKKRTNFTKVTNLEMDWQEYKGEFENFEIRYIDVEEEGSLKN